MHDKAINPLWKAVNALESARVWCDNAMLAAQSLSLQGEKRRNRYAGTLFYNLRKHLQTKAYDLTGSKVVPDAAPGKVDAETIPEYFDELEDQLWALYEALHAAGNELVIAKYDPIACDIKKMYHCVYEEVIDIGRKITEGKLFDWSWHVLHTQQIHRENVHDHYEKLEKAFD